MPINTLLHQTHRHNQDHTLLVIVEKDKSWSLMCKLAYYLHGDLPTFIGRRQFCLTRLRMVILSSCDCVYALVAMCVFQTIVLLRVLVCAYVVFVLLPSVSDWLCVLVVCGLH